MLQVPYDMLVRFIWNSALVAASSTEQSIYATYGINYALLAGVVALFLTSPGLDLRTRLRGVVRWAIPSVVALQLTKPLWSTAVESYSATTGATGLWNPTNGGADLLTVALHIGLSLVVWHLWLQQLSRAKNHK